jgi:hypothetical protein
VIHKRFEKGVSESEKYEYDDEQLLLVGDWYHRSAVDVQASYLTFRSSGNEVTYLQNICSEHADCNFSLFRIPFSSMDLGTSIVQWPSHLSQ